MIKEVGTTKSNTNYLSGEKSMKKYTLTIETCKGKTFRVIHYWSDTSDNEVSIPDAQTATRFMMVLEEAGYKNQCKFPIPSGKYPTATVKRRKSDANEVKQ